MAKSIPELTATEMGRGEKVWKKENDFHVMKVNVLISYVSCATDQCLWF